MFRKPSKSGQKTRDADAAFRDLIWARDKGKDRATGRPLSRFSDNWDDLGDVCHIKPKGIYPELRHDPRNAVLLSRTNHILSDGRGGYLLTIEGDDANQPLTFTRRDRHGVLIWTAVR